MTEKVVQALVAARRDRTTIPAGLAPNDLDDAFAISAAVMRALGETPGGWKVGYAPDGSPVAAPMYASAFLKTGATWSRQPGRPMIPEVEIAARLGRDLPPRPTRAYTRDEILDSTSELLIGLELIERRIPPRDAPFALNLADDLGNIGYVAGATTADFRGLDLATLRCRFWMGGKLVNDRLGGHPKGDPLAPFIDWANAQRDLIGGLKAGQIVTLGSLTPMVEMSEASVLEAEIEPIGRVRAEIV